jgi:predicted SprT family Zn-dependent metalloprotease
MPRVSSTKRLTTSEEAMRMQGVLSKARQIGELHGLSSDWSFVLDQATTRAGITRYHKKQISISRHLVLNESIPWRSVENVILHEVAHALAGYDAGHGPEWKTKAMSIGCDGERCHSLFFVKPRGVKSCACGATSLLVYKVRLGAKPKTCKWCKSALVLLLI